jgi:hypothetical protein
MLDSSEIKKKKHQLTRRPFPLSAILFAAHYVGCWCREKKSHREKERKKVKIFVCFGLLLKRGARQSRRRVIS